MKILKKIINAFYTVLITILVLLAIATALTITKSPTGHRLFVVLSGSMEPSIQTGAVVFVAPQKEYKQNDVITFFANPNVTDLKASNTTVTHRIVAINEDQTFQTKGDANEDPDRESVAVKSILGKVLFSVPYLGKIIAFTKTQTGFIILIIIPATLIIYSELNSIKNEIKNMIEKKEKKPQKKKIVPDRKNQSDTKEFKRKNK